MPSRMRSSLNLGIAQKVGILGHLSGPWFVDFVDSSLSIFSQLSQKSPNLVSERCPMKSTLGRGRREPGTSLKVSGFTRVGW